jgi:hypothetical protein
LTLPGGCWAGAHQLATYNTDGGWLNFDLDTPIVI